MSLFSSKPATPRYDLLDRHEEHLIEKAQAENIREPYVANNRDAVWVGDRIAAVIENPTPRWWYIAVSMAASLAGLTGLGILYLVTTGVGVWGENNSTN